MGEHKHYSIEQKRTAAELAIKHRDGGGNYSDIAKVAGVHPTMMGKWVDAYQSGKLELPPKEKTSTLKAFKEIDIRPELKKIAKSIDDLVAICQFLNSNTNQACIRLDAIYSKLTEYQEIAKEVSDEINGEKG